MVEFFKQSDRRLRLFQSAENVGSVRPCTLICFPFPPVTKDAVLPVVLFLTKTPIIK